MMKLICRKYFSENKELSEAELSQKFKSNNLKLSKRMNRKDGEVATGCSQKVMCQFFHLTKTCTCRKIGNLAKR